MANILDQLFRLTPVDEPMATDKGITASSDDVGDNTISSVQSAQAQAQSMLAEQGQAGPEDATGDNFSMEDLASAIKDALGERDAQIAALQKQVQQLQRYGAASVEEHPALGQQETLSTDAPKDYVPLREMNFDMRAKE